MCSYCIKTEALLLNWQGRQGRDASRRAQQTVQIEVPSMRVDAAWSHR
jgi:hypothetical protein